MLKKSLGGQDDLLIIESPTYDKNTLERLRGQVSGVTRFDIWAHGNVENGEHHFLSGPRQSTPTKNLFKKLREIVGEETPLTNVNLWSCFGGAAAKDVKELGASSTLICHADEKFETLVPTTLNKIIAAETQTGRESFLDSFLHSPETVTFSQCQAGGEVVKHTVRRSRRAITVDAELSRHLEEEFKKFSSFLSNAELPTDDLPAAKLSAETIKKYQEEDIILSAFRDNPERLLEYFLAKDSFKNKKFNLNQITIGTMQESPLFWAAKNGHKKSVKALIDCEADVNFVNYAGITALMSAAQDGHTDVVRELISGKVDVNFSNDAGATALIYASQNGHTDVVKELILGGANVSFADGNLRTALTVAAKTGHAKSVKVLIKNGADVNFTDNVGATAIMYASQNGHTDVVRELILGGADVNIEDNEKRTALTAAVAMNRAQSVQVLIENGANVNFVKDDGFTDLISAAHYGHTDVVRELILGGADVNFKSDAGFTALMFASDSGHKDVVNELIAGGADVNFKSDTGLTALSLALRRGEKDPIYEMLKASLNTPRVNTEQDLFPSKSSSIEVAPIKSITAKKDPIYGATNPSLDKAEVDTKEHRSASQSSSIVAPSTSMTAMTVTALFAVGLAALFMWRRKGRYSDPETRPNSQVNKPIAKKTEERAQNKGKTS